MTDSLSQWLSLREQADTSARSAALVERVAAVLPAERPLRIVDLGSGTGSNIRYLAPRLPQPQEWLAVDRDPALLAQGPPGVRTRALELGPLDDATLFAGSHLVTASALLDLVSSSWLRRLTGYCAAARASVLFALTYDGRSTCSPLDSDDEVIRELFNRHQRANDKGFGRAAGPDAAEQLVDCLTALGYDVRSVPSDWRLGPDQDALQRGLVQGWADAAGEIDPDRTATIARWLERRLAHIGQHQSHITVGHTDVAAWPPRSRG